MKKIYCLVIVAALVGCAGSRNHQPVFDHILIKQINIKNPSFTLAVESDANNYYLNQLEDAFIKNKITLYSSETQISNANTEGKSKGVAVNNSGALGVANTRIKALTTGKMMDIDNTNATYIYILDCHNWTFKVILTETRELIMKGYIRNDFDSEVLTMYQKLNSN